jgi:hypothetical protein
VRHAVRVLFWESTADAARCGIEIADLPPGKGRMEAELDRILGSLGDVRPAFVLAGFQPGQPEELAAAISGASELFFHARVCVAVDEKTLQLIDSEKLCSKNLGIVLDHVDATTPLSALSAELVDAVRFEDSFVRRASTDLRSSCVIDAMLKLAHDLGIATLASGSPSKNNFGFDYVLSAPSAA